jgi:Fe-S cluster assembly protein SufD
MSVAAHGDYLAGLLAGQAQQPAPQAPLSALRAEAVDRMSALTVPTTRDEDWRFTDISPLTGVSFQPPRAVPTLTPADIAAFELAEAGSRLVFVDGVYAPQLSSNAGGLAVTTLEAGAARHAALLDAHLGRHAEFRNEVFAALNTAFLRDGALVIVPRGQEIAAPVHVLWVATQPEAAAYPRCLVVAGAAAAVTVIEDFVAMQDEAYFTNAVTEIAAGAGAKVAHVRVQREGGRAFHIANCSVVLERDAEYREVNVAVGARISRYNLNVLQSGEGAQCAIDGLALIDGRRLADTHTTIDHAKAHGVSRQLHKCIVDGAAHAVFNGKILVRPGAQLTDSMQTSRSLLLSGKARVDTKPQLEIYADDVKCAHGAAVGQLDPDEVFYLRSRGLSESAARNLLTYAFGGEIIRRIPVKSLAQRLEEDVLAQTRISRP